LDSVYLREEELLLHLVAAPTSKQLLAECANAIVFDYLFDAETVIRAISPNGCIIYE
jgi:hypothetical protein